MCLSTLIFHRKGSFPAHSEIYQSFNQREGQLHSTGELLKSALGLSDNAAVLYIIMSLILRRLNALLKDRIRLFKVNPKAKLR